jgi:2-dehydropantoate 2-reductase
MKVAVLGGGAIGSLLAARLAKAGCDVTLVVRGSGWRDAPPNAIRLIDAMGEQTIPVQIRAAAETPELCDILVIAVKAHAIADAIAQVLPRIGPNTIVLTATNGVPWWFFIGEDAAPRQGRLQSVDPDGVIAKAIGRQPLVGCVLFPAAQSPGPGSVRHLGGNRIVVGNPIAAQSHASNVAAMFTHAGFDAPVAPDIRAVVWAKVVGNAAVNPLSVLTGATMQEIAENRDLSQLVTNAMAEIDAVGASMSILPSMPMAERLKLIASVGPHKTSMLQDFEAGRTLELSPLLGAVCEIARWACVPTPVLNTLQQLVSAKLLRVAGHFQEALNGRA